MAITRFEDLDLANQRVLIREDLNAPVKDGMVTSSKRLVAALPTIQAARKQNARVLLMAHRGRPTEGCIKEEDSLAPMADWLSTSLGQSVRLVKDYLEHPVEVAPGEVVLLENCRMNVGEKANDDALAKRYAALCDVFIMDAFGTAHRAQASTSGVIKFAPQAASGLLLAAELDALGAAFNHPKRPLLAIVGGSKVSTKLSLLESLVTKVDYLIVGGGIANTFLAAKGLAVGNSLMEKDLVKSAQKIMHIAQRQGVILPLPEDVRVASEFSSNAKATIKPAAQVGDQEMILDIGPDTQASYANLVHKAQTIVWNGPVGVFEFPEFAEGTRHLAEAIADNEAFAVAGGGDTIAAMEQFGVADKLSYTSTGGGAFLEFLEGKKLPAIQALLQRQS